MSAASEDSTSKAAVSKDATSKDSDPKDSDPFPFPDEITIKSEYRMYLTLIESCVGETVFGTTDINDVDDDVKERVFDFFEYTRKDVVSKKEVDHKLSLIQDDVSEELYAELEKCFKSGVDSDENCLKALKYLQKKLTKASSQMGAFIDFVEAEEGVNFPMEAFADTLSLLTDDTVSDQDSDLLNDCHQYLLSYIS